MNNEVLGVSVLQEIMERMRRTTTKEAGFREGFAIARETYHDVRSVVGGVQIAAPFGRVDPVTQMPEE